jgi:proteasome assembly chaperone (PAC2) family protein
VSTLPERPSDDLVLRRPVLLAAFEGWNDAGDAATSAVEHLEDQWAARAVAAVDPDAYYDFQVNRPQVQLVDGVTRRVTWPTTRVSVCSPPGAGRDVVLVRGLEPNMRWRGFCAELVAIAEQLGVDLVVTLGALLADSPHTRPVPVSGTASNPATAAELGLESSRYEGPTGIVGVFQDACTQAGMTSVSFWAAVPHYVAQPPCPKATIALLRRVEDLLDIPVPLDDLPERARAWERQVDELAAEDSDVAEYIASLEEREPETELPEASGEAIAKEFERYLRRRDDGPRA